MDSYGHYFTLSWILLSVFVSSMDLAVYGNQYISPDHVVLSAAVCKASCYHRCLHRVNNDTREKGQMQSDPTVPETSTSMIEEKCKKYQSSFILSCTSSCEFAGDAGSILDKCTSHCQDKNNFCKEGCGFLADALKTSVGTCPDTEEVDKMVDRECHVDQQCYLEGDVKKCCNLRCVVPKFPQNTGPSLWPPTIMEGKDGSSFEMTWKYDDSTFLDTLIPVLFVLQVRTHFNKDFESTKSSNWKTLLITFRVGVHLQDLQPGMWYQFRVASVTSFGTRGFKSISPPVRLSRVPREPGPPRNLTDGAWRISTNGNINIQIHWLEPATVDIAITEYKISWVRDHGFIQPDGQSLEALTDFVQTVTGTQRNYDIEGLLPDKTYKVQVRALCKWGSMVLMSRPNTIFLTTAATPSMDTERIISKESVSTNDLCMCQKGALDPRLFLGAPYLHKNSLSVDLQILRNKDKPSFKVTYSPKVCIDSEMSPLSYNRLQIPIKDVPDMYREKTITSGQANITLSLLQFSCRYNVQVQTIKIPASSPQQTQQQQWIKDDQDMVDEADTMSTCFCTPSCLNLISQYRREGIDNLRCLHKVTPRLKPPEKLYQQRSQKNPQSFLIFWTHPYRNSTIDWGTLNVRYRVIWGPSIDDHIDSTVLPSEVIQFLLPRIDMSQAETKVLKENVSSIWLENLRTNQFYVVQVQTIMFESGLEQISAKQSLVLSTYKDSFHQKMSLYSNPLNDANWSQQVSVLKWIIFAILFYMFVH